MGESLSFCDYMSYIRMDCHLESRAGLVGEEPGLDHLAISDGSLVPGIR